MVRFRLGHLILVVMKRRVGGKSGHILFRLWALGTLVALVLGYKVALADESGGDRREIGGATAVGYIRPRSLTEGGCVAWVLRLVEIGTEGEGSCADVVEISRPDGLVDIADLGLTLAEAKLVLAGVQREIVAAQARDHAVRRPGCRRCEGVCRVKD